MSRAPEDEEDELPELPPVDDGDDEGDQAQLGTEDDLVLDEAGASLDDADAAELDVGAEHDAAEDESAREGETEGEETIDVGALDDDIDLQESGDGGEDEPELVDAGDAIADLADGEDDGGAEGTDDDPEAAVDEAALPPLDADDEGAANDDAFADVLIASAGAAHAWDSARLLAAEGAGANVPTVAVATHDGRVMAVGDALLVVTEGLRAAKREPRASRLEGSPVPSLAGPFASVAMSEELSAFATRRGQVFWSGDLGATTALLGAFTAACDPLSIAATPGRVWVLADGALWAYGTADERLVAVRARGVRRIAASAGVVVVLADAEPTGLSIERLRRDDERWPPAMLDAETRTIAGSEAAQLAVTYAGGAIALTDGARVAVSRDGGKTFAALEIDARAMTFAGDDATAPLIVAVERNDEDGFGLLKLDARGRLTRLADLTAAPAAIAWDGARDLVWVASNGGLSALGHPAKH